MNTIPFRRERGWIERESLGVSFGNPYKLAWGRRHGHLRWVPYRIKTFIVSGWNVMACLILGHSELVQAHPNEKPVCCDCMRRVTPDAFDNVTKEWEIDEAGVIKESEI